MSEYEKRLRFLCMAVDNFHWVSGNIIFPEEKRRQVLKKFAAELKTASENFIKACEEIDREQT